MSKEKTLPALKIHYANDLDLIEIILSIYAIGNRAAIRPFEMTVLKYYIKYGFTEEAVEWIKDDEGKTNGDIRVANHWLRDKGYLNLGVTNLRKSTLSKDMEYIRKSFVEDKKNLYALIFERADV